MCAASEDRVVDSRLVEDGAAIRRRRECDRCSARFTTFERIEEVAPMVQKSDGRRVPFSADQIERGILAAAKGRPITPGFAARVAADVERMIPSTGVISSSDIGIFVLDQLRGEDQVAYLRFASVYKAFQDPADFERELGLLAKVVPKPEAAR